MNRKDIKSITVEYQDGDVDTFQEPGMRHVWREDFNRGAPNMENSFLNHEIRWVEKKK